MHRTCHQGNDLYTKTICNSKSKKSDTAKSKSHAPRTWHRPRPDNLLSNGWWPCAACSGRGNYKDRRGRTSMEAEEILQVRLSAHPRSSAMPDLSVLQKLQRDINCLSDSNKTTRRRALERLRRETIGQKPLHPSQVIAALFEALLKPLLKSFSDPMEKCRDLSIETVSE